VTSELAVIPLNATPTYNATKAAMHSSNLAMREALKGKVEVIELAPPTVQTGSHRAGKRAKAISSSPSSLRKS
jgi:uncharacterized oxidoreductase